MTTPIYQANNLTFGYSSGPPVLKGCDFMLKEGDFLGLIGPNGAGKSTLLYLLTRWLSPQAGRILFRGHGLRETRRSELARHVAVVPQREEQVFSFNVEEIVLMGRYIHRESPFGFESEEDHRVCRECLALAGLEGFEKRRASELSGGEYQRLLIARALAQEAPVLLLDEPTASLDLSHQRQVFRLLERLNKEQGVTVLTVSHDINLAALYCRELALLHKGRLQFQGTPEEVLDADRLSRIYNVPLTTGRGPNGQPALWIEK